MNIDLMIKATEAKRLTGKYYISRENEYTGSASGRQEEAYRLHLCKAIRGSDLCDVVWHRTPRHRAWIVPDTYSEKLAQTWPKYGDSIQNTFQSIFSRDEVYEMLKAI